MSPQFQPSLSHCHCLGGRIAMRVCATGLLVLTLQLAGGVPGMELAAIAQTSTPTSLSNPDSTKDWSAATLSQTIAEPNLIPGSPDMIAVSPNNRWVASAVVTNADGLGDSVRVWDVTTGEELYTVGGHHPFVSAIAFSPDNRFLATAYYNYEQRMMTIRIWDAATGQRVRSLFRALSPKYIVPGGGYYHRVALAFSPDGTTLYSTATNPVIQEWDVETGQLRRNLVGYREVVRSLAVSPNASTLATTHVDGTITLIDLATGQRRDGAVGGRDGFNVAFSPDGQTVAAMFDFRLSVDQNWRQLGLWNAQTMQLVRQLYEYPADAWVVFNPVGGTFATAVYGEGIEIHSLETGEAIAQFPITTSNFVFSPDGQLLVAATPDGIQIWR